MTVNASKRLEKILWDHIEKLQNGLGNKKSQVKRKVNGRTFSDLTFYLAFCTNEALKNIDVSIIMELIVLFSNFLPICLVVQCFRIG